MADDDRRDGTRERRGARASDPHAGGHPARDGRAAAGAPHLHRNARSPGHRPVDAEHRDPAPHDPRPHEEPARRGGRPGRAHHGHRAARRHVLRRDRAQRPGRGAHGVEPARPTPSPWPSASARRSSPRRTCSTRPDGSSSPTRSRPSRWSSSSASSSTTSTPKTSRSEPPRSLGRRVDPAAGRRDRSLRCLLARDIGVIPPMSPPQPGDPRERDLELSRRVVQRQEGGQTSSASATASSTTGRAPT